MDLSSLLLDITNYKGWLSGSYVRDVLIRKDPTYVIRDIDVLIPFALHKMLVRVLGRKYNLTKEVIDYNRKEQIAHTHLHFGAIIIDIFSSEMYEYLSPPDFDVNTLCWTGEEFTIWYPVGDDDEEFYGYPFDVDSIIERALRKEAVAMVGEWVNFDKEYMEERFDKLVLKDWTILNYEQGVNFLLSS